MKDLTERIIVTILLSMCFFGILNLSVEYFIALFNQDDDAMFFIGFTFIVITCLVVLTIILIELLFNIWSKNKNNKKKDDK